MHVTFDMRDFCAPYLIYLAYFCYVSIFVSVSADNLISIPDFAYRLSMPKQTARRSADRQQYPNCAVTPAVHAGYNILIDARPPICHEETVNSSRRARLSSGISSSRFSVAYSLHLEYRARRHAVLFA